ncbi:hypothetical protein HPB48_004771 [Haemaphysalis longicornis]|uniref:Uncharacterized protein n=1 Tax=Haemaphysalis longicornis TaxID=44386 RepID=A0A9J6G2N0_HAELO|nr:hypothetical protein HPB48_004771 [Haemaphysalis longicornis]
MDRRVRRTLRRRILLPPSKPAPESPLPPALRHRPSTRQPRQPPLPTDDFKIGIHQRNGPQLSRADPISLTASIAREIGFPTSPAPFQLRVGAEQNVIVVSTPSPAAARALESLQKTVVFSNRHEVSVYPITPYNSCCGVIHNIAQEHPEEYVKSLITASGYEVLTARRLGDSKAFVITFRGKRVPYYVYVNQDLLSPYGRLLHPLPSNGPPSGRLPLASRHAQVQGMRRLPQRASAHLHTAVWAFLKVLHTQPHLKTAQNGTSHTVCKAKKLQTSPHRTSPAGRTPPLLARGATVDLIVRAQDRAETRVTGHNQGGYF